MSALHAIADKMDLLDVVPPAWWTGDEWSTPADFVARCAARFGAFDLDVCARAETAKAPHFYSLADNGLTKPWYGHVWCNPPYSNPRPWVERAATSETRATLLLPASIDANWFHDFVEPHASVIYVRGRIRFLGWNGLPAGSPRAGNVLAIYPKLTRAFDAAI